MKIQTNLRAGSGQKRNSSGAEVQVEVPSAPAVPVSRCAGI
jgi:hypothetical protein